MQPLRLIVFEGVQNLPIFAGEERGTFAGHGIDLNLAFTPNSWTLRNGLADGTYDIAHTAVDNAIAMVELSGHDVAVVMGGDNGFNNLFFQKGISSYEDLRGRTVLVDAPNTAFALVLYRILEKHGLGRQDYVIESVGATPLRLESMLKDETAAAAIMNLPFLVLAQKAGLQWKCKATDEIGPYLSTAGFAMRGWAAQNADLLTRYIRAYVEALRWSLDPVNRDASIDILARRLHLTPDIAAECYGIATTADGGLAADAHVDREGLENVLRLRAEVEGQWNGKAPPADRYLDLSYHRAALG